jgi:transcriptional regulator GlxA family with amidase domain
MSDLKSIAPRIEHLIEENSGETWHIPSSSVESIRLKKAALLLQNGNFTVSETMCMVGFTNSPYFSKSFGRTHREYRPSYRSGESLPE